MPAMILAANFINRPFAMDKKVKRLSVVGSVHSAQKPHHKNHRTNIFDERTPETEKL
jgi:hypothetical protein